MEEDRTLTLISIHCHKPGYQTSKSCHTSFLATFAYNVNFPGKLEKFTGILFSQDGSMKCTNWWNRTDISIDGHLARG